MTKVSNGIIGVKLFFYMKINKVRIELTLAANLFVDRMIKSQIWKVTYSSKSRVKSDKKYLLTKFSNPIFFLFN